MKQIMVIGAVVLVLCLSASTSPDAVQANQAAKPTPSQRLISLERKMANLEKLVGVPLDDERAIAKIVQEREEAMATVQASSLIAMLQTIRSQLELYQVQHNGNYPDLTYGWIQLISKTDEHGRTVPLGMRGFGPYLQLPPVNPFTNNSNIINTVKDAGPESGWIYNPSNGLIKAVVPASEARKFDLNGSDVLTYVDTN